MITEPEDITANKEGVAFPKVFTTPHRRLRGAQGGETSICEGSNRKFSIKPGVRLGHSMTTDVLELMLWWFDGQPLTDRQVAYSLAVAIRSGIASMLGIEVDELGCDTKPIRLDGGVSGQAIVIFDRSASGYCSSVTNRLREVLGQAKEALNCSAECEGACQHCLLSYDTRFRLDDLNRQVALDFLTERWLADFELQAGDALFGKDRTNAEFQSLPEAITRELARPDIEELRMYLLGDVSEWDIASSPLRSWIQRWASSPCIVKIILAQTAVNELSQADRFALHVMSNLDNVSIWSGDVPACSPNGYVVAEIISAGKSRAWAYPTSYSAYPAANWGVNNGALLVFGNPELSGILVQPLNFATDTPVETSGRVCRVEVSNALDGISSGFGERLLTELECKFGSSLIGGSSDIVRVAYRDRYLNSPLPAALLLDFISAFKRAYKERWAVQSVELGVVPFAEEVNSFKKPSMFFNNWPTSTARDEAIREAFEYCGMSCILQSMPKQDVIHARLLEIECEDGHVTKAWLDQGFSYWQVPKLAGNLLSRQASQFPFNDSAQEQGRAVSEARVRIEGQIFPTYIFVESE
ncbi:hypothetical protein CAP31_08765 [Sulfuriferula sp. AH1]|uniref:DUF1998 domain-containing protein n=1 Tax=Sulfuriferula sp. AH1 TaxID=1985873 RepID=UPI000B3B7DD5|nr:DUF1998 domain-containing protein [Sulfuriferula sp. AH1]ARU31762.1 hypothetical protein CAP31_08765 [Sulfuriferula sp. AH1]